MARAFEPVVISANDLFDGRVIYLTGKDEWVSHLRQAELKGWRITQIWNTHWHPDHAGGNAAIKAATGCTIVAPGEVERISPIDRIVKNGDTVRIGAIEA